MSIPFYDLSLISFVDQPINFTGNFLTYELADVNKFSVDSQGNVTLAGTIPAGHLSGLGTLPDSVLSSNVALLNANNQFTGQPQYFRGSLSTSANYGRLSLGSGAFDGTTSGFFVGSGSGTQLAINAASTFTGNFVDYQVAGVSKYKLDYQGNLTLSGTIPAGNLTGSHTLPDGVLSTNVPLLNVSNVFTNTQAVTTIFGLSLPPLTFAGVNLAAGGTLSVGTTYYYVLTAVDPIGGETTQTSERSVTPTTGNQTASVTWALDGRPAKFRVYRSTVSGNYTGVSYFDVINGIASNVGSFSDTGSVAATGTGTPPSVSTAYYAKFNTSVTQNASIPGVFITLPSQSGATGVALALGNGPFDGVSPGAFQGVNGGTLIGANWFSNADFINFQAPISNATLVNDAAAVAFRVHRLGGVTIGYRHAGTTPALRLSLAAPTASSLTTSTTGGTLPDNTTYYYTVAAVDVRGNAGIISNEKTVTTGTAGTNTNSNTLTWSLGTINTASWFYVYRSTTSGVYTSATRYQVINAAGNGTVTYLDTGSAGTTAAAIIGVSPNAAWFALDPYNTGGMYIGESNTSSTHPVIAIGSGPFDGVSPGAYTGQTNVLIGINLRNGTSNTGVLQVQQAAAPANGVINGTKDNILLIDTAPNISIKSTGTFRRYMLSPTPNTPTTATSGGTLLDNTTYYYVVTPIDVIGGEGWISPAQSQVTTGNSGSNVNTNTITWTAQTGAIGYFIYRSTVSNNFTSSTRYKVVNATTFSDTGATGTTATPPTANAGSAFDFRLGTNNAFYLPFTGAVATRGSVNIGNGPFDNSTTGFFSGPGSGTHLAINTVSGYAGDLINAQVAGISYFKSGAGGLNGFAAATGTVLTLSVPAIAIANTPSTSTSGGTLLDTTSYFYEVTALDVLGVESGPAGQVTVTTGNSGGNTNSNTVTWTSERGVMGYNVYRSTTTGNFTNSKKFTVIGMNTATFTDTGAAGTTATPPATASLGASGMIVKRNGGSDDGFYFGSGVAGARHGTFNIGSGPFDASSTGFFAGASSGTELAINAISGYTGSLIDAQIAGVSFFSVNQTTGVKFANPTSGVQINANLLTVSVINTPTTSTSGGTLLDNTAYFYEVCALDVFNTETPASVQVTVTTGNSGGNTNSNTVTWTAIRGAMGYNIYRSTTTGNFTNSKKFTSVGTAVSFTDTGAAGTTATPTAAGTINAIMMRLDATNGSIAGYYFADNAFGARHGILNIGSGPFDNATTGKFAGNASGTHIALNAVSGYAGNLEDFQVAGVSKWSVTPAGNIAFAGVMVPGVLDAPVFASTLSLTVTAGEVHKVGSITGAMTINASAGGVAGQRMTIILPNDSSGTGWVVTFGTNFKPAGTLTGTSAKSATASFISDGTSWYETTRATGLTL